MQKSSTSTAYFGGSGLGYSDYDFEKTGYMPPPKPSLNGGLYTGKAFDKDAPWGNIPVTPDAPVYTHLNLRSSSMKPHPEAYYQYPGHTRPGNNFLQTPGVELNEANIMCVRPLEKDVPKAHEYMFACQYAPAK